jgi:hypothetical protein
MNPERNNKAIEKNLETMSPDMWSKELVVLG